MRWLSVPVLVLCLGACSLLPGQQVNKRYFVFFNEWSAEPDQSSTAIVRTAANYAKQHPTLHVDVLGYTDPTGSPQANIDLSRARAQRVIDLLVADGVDASRIRGNGKGILPYKWASQESRRVDIVLD
jgi:outer membrane protein OmpA-like peptidoglycan-associated protein